MAKPLFSLIIFMVARDATSLPKGVCSMRNEGVISAKRFFRKGCCLSKSFSFVSSVISVIASFTPSVSVLSEFSLFSAGVPVPLPAGSLPWFAPLSSV